MGGTTTISRCGTTRCSLGSVSLPAHPLLWYRMHDDPYTTARSLGMFVGIHVMVARRIRKINLPSDGGLRVLSEACCRRHGCPWGELIRQQNVACGERVGFEETQ